MTPVSEHGLSLWAIDDTIAQLMEMREEITERMIIAGDATSQSEQATANREELVAIESELSRYLNEALPAKVDGIRGFLRQDEAVAEAAEAEAKRLKAIAEARRGRIARLKDYLLAAMHAAGKKKLEGRSGGSITVCGNGGVAQLVIDNPEIVPDEYCRWRGWVSCNAWEAMKIYRFDKLPGCELKREPDAALIRAALDLNCLKCDGNGVVEQSDGIDWDDSENPCKACGGSGKAGVPGAHINGRGEHVRIR